MADAPKTFRILHAVRSLAPEAGGPMEGIRRLAAIGKQQGYDLEALSLDPPDAPFLSSLPFRAHPLGPVESKYGYTPKLSRWLRDNLNHYDGVVINGLWQFHSYGTYREIRGKKPYVVFCHGMMDPWFKKRYPLKHLKKWLYWAPFEYRVLRDARRVMFTSEMEKTLAEESFWLHKWTPQVVPYGTTGPDVDETSAREAFFGVCPELRGKPFLVYLSRIDRKKGCDLLVEAFARFMRESQVKLVMAGPDATNWRPELEATAMKLGIADRIVWPGMLAGAQKWGAFYASEAYILPSHQENFGIAVAEALACARPVLTTKQVNIWPDLVEARCGYVEDDTLAGVEALLRKWSATGPEERIRMGQRGLELFSRRYNLRRTAPCILESLGLTGEDADAA